MLLNQRAVDILNQLVLSAEEHVTIEELAKHYNVSERSIRWDLEAIDEYLKMNQMPVLKREAKVDISLANGNISRKQRDGLLNKIEKNEFFLTPSQRRKWVFVIILFQNQLIDVHYLMEYMQVSRSTIIDDIRKLKKELIEKDIYLEYAIQSGYVLKGNEYSVRREGISLLSDQNILKSYVKQSILNNQWELIRSEDFEFIENLVAETELVLKIRYSGDAFTNLVNGILIMITRMDKNCFINFIEQSKVLKDTEYMSFARQVQKIEKRFKIEIPNEEIWFLVNLFLEGNLMSSDNFLDDNWINLHLLTNQFIEKMSINLNVPLYKDSDLFNALVLHLGPAINRLRNKVFLKNEIIQYIQDTYLDLFTVVKQTLDSLILDNNIIFPVDEIGFITLHIASSLERLSMKDRKLNILIVCNYGIGTSKLLKTRMKKYLSYNIQGVVSIRELKEYFFDKKDIDLIVSTVPLKGKYSVPVIEVSPLLTKEEIKMLQEVELIYTSNISNKESEIVDKHRGEWIPVLKDLLVEGTVATNIEVETWEEAVRFGGELLKEKGVIEKEYIDAMINSVKELGPYIVIAPNIAMPHASSKDGVNEIGISLITLKEPVNFGHPQNDPVKIVICLAAVDHTSHLNALQDLVGYLNDESFITFLKEEDSAEKIVDFIEREGNSENGFSERTLQKK